MVPRLKWLCYSSGKERESLVSVFVDTEVLDRECEHGTRWARKRRDSERRKKSPTEAEPSPPPPRVSLLPLTPTHNEDAVLQAAITINNSILPCVTAGFLSSRYNRALSLLRGSRRCAPPCCHHFNRGVFEGTSLLVSPFFSLLFSRVGERKGEKERARARFSLNRVTSRTKEYRLMTRCTLDSDIAPFLVISSTIKPGCDVPETVVPFSSPPFSLSLSFFLSAPSRFGNTLVIYVINTAGRNLTRDLAWTRVHGRNASDNTRVTIPSV